jgi:uncharacterized membrane protein YdjX (TVP38/TMEM64 family)
MFERTRAPVLRQQSGDGAPANADHARVIATWVIGLAVVGVIVVIGWATLDIWRAAWDHAVALFASPAAFREWIGSFGVWAPVIFLLATAGQVIVAPIPGSVFPTVGAVAFGPAAALALTMGGMLIGSAVMFTLARRCGRPLVERLVGRELLDRYTRLISARDGLWLFLIYLLPLLPDDAVSAVAGLSAFSFRRFLVLSALGRLPGMIFTVYATAGLLTQPIWVWAVAGAALAVGLAMAVTYRASLERWLLGRGQAGVHERNGATE